MGGLIKDSVAYLLTRTDVDANRLGLTGFCAGGRYTMPFLPQMSEFKSGVAFYGFPYSGGFANQSMPADYIGQLNKPMLMIHGTSDHRKWRTLAEFSCHGRLQRDGDIL